MKVIGKIVVVASACALAVVLGACGSSNQAQPAATSAASDSSASAAAAAPAQTSAAVETSVAIEKSAAVETSAAVTPANAASYENAYFGVAFDLPEGWVFLDATAQQSSLSEAGADAKIEMVAAPSDGSGQIVITVEPLNEQNANQDEATHAAGLFGESVAGGEITDVTITLGTREIPAKMVTLEANGQKVVALAAAMKGDDGFLDIVLTAPSQEEIGAVINNLIAL